MCSEFQGPCPRPEASASGQPCVVSCGASRVIIFPPPVLVTFPGPILSTCPQETVVGASGIPEGIPEGRAGTSPEIPPCGRFVPKFVSRPVLDVDPQENVLGSSGTVLGSSGTVLGSSGMALGSLGMLEGGAGTSRTSLRSRRAQIPISAGFIPKSGPGRASRCSYIFNSRWIHPCRRSGFGKQQPAGNGGEEKIPAPEKPGKEEADEGKEEKEVLEV